MVAQLRIRNPTPSGPSRPTQFPQRHHSLLVESGSRIEYLLNLACNYVIWIWSRSLPYRPSVKLSVNLVNPHASYIWTLWIRFMNRLGSESRFFIVESWKYSSCAFGSLHSGIFDNTYVNIFYEIVKLFISNKFARTWSARAKRNSHFQNVGPSGISPVTCRL